VQLNLETNREAIFEQPVSQSAGILLAGTGREKHFTTPGQVVFIEYLSVSYTHLTLPTSDLV